MGIAKLPYSRLRDKSSFLTICSYAQPNKLLIKKEKRRNRSFALVYIIRIQSCLGPEVQIMPYNPNQPFSHTYCEF